MGQHRAHYATVGFRRVGPATPIPIGARRENALDPVVPGRIGMMLERAPLSGESDLGGEEPG